MRGVRIVAPRSLGSVLSIGALLQLGTVLACAPAATTGTGGERIEEQVGQTAGRSDRARPRPDASESGAPTALLPAGDARAVHGTIDPRTGRRTSEPAVGQRLREPRRADLQAGRIRQAPEEYAPEAGTLPYGYRIQVVAAPDMATASTEATRVRELLEGRYPVYVEFIDPYYKVRVGDFVTPEQAHPALAELRRLGFPDAWEVRTTIMQDVEQRSGQGDRR